MSKSALIALTAIVLWSQAECFLGNGCLVASASNRPAPLKERRDADCSVLPSVERRDAIAVLGGATLSLFSPLRSEAKAGKGGGGVPANPKDKERLEEAATVIGAIEEKLKDESKWDEIVETVTKEPFTKDAMDKLFSLAARSLPPNIQKIYGGDGGQWVGLKNEAVDAMDAFSAEITYLQGEKKRGKPMGDTADLNQYFATARDKTKAFLALYSNTELNSQLKGGGFCAYSSSAKCDEFDNSKDVKEAVKAGGIYNELRLGR